MLKGQAFCKGCQYICLPRASVRYLRFFSKGKITIDLVHTNDLQDLLLSLSTTRQTSDLIRISLMALDE